MFTIWVGKNTWADVLVTFILPQAIKSITSLCKDDKYLLLSNSTKIQFKGWVHKREEHSIYDNKINNKFKPCKFSKKNTFNKMFFLNIFYSQNIQLNLNIYIQISFIMFTLQF